jgi:putative tryptophan/tyrosine transport system substrate-binding protein
MKRREFIALFGCMTAWPHAPRAQQTKRIPRLCFLTFDPGSLEATRFGAFFDGLRAHGYVTGQTIVIDYLSADGRGERFPALAAECVRRKADVIVVSTTPATEAAKEATQTIPIVMTNAVDPVATGLVASLARPGGNVTGISLMGALVAAKRLELLKEVVPGISRVLVFAYFADPVAAPQVRALEDTAQALRVKLQVRDVATADEIPVAFEAGAKERAEGLVITTASIFNVNHQRIVELAARYRLPVIYSQRAIAEAGGLMSYGPRFSELYRRAAAHVDKLLKGAKAADLPIEQPTISTSRRPKRLG